jgi:hypothetical protein
MYQAMALEQEPYVTQTLQTLRARKAEMLEPVVLHLGRFIAEGPLPAWSPPVFGVVLLGTRHEACWRFLAGAPLDLAWMRATLPELAWRSLGSAENPR